MAAAIRSAASTVASAVPGAVRYASTKSFFANAPEALFSLPNVVLQPHIGSATLDTRKAMGQLVVDNLAAHFAGRPLVTPIG